MNCFVWQTCSGIKGLSPLHILPTFDIISGVAIDYMHCLLEGIGKRLFAIWLTPSAHAYSIGKHIQLLDKCLLSIKPPDTISRVPQAISNRKKWKGVVMALLCMHVYFTSLCMYTKHIQDRNLGLGCYITASQCWRGSFHPPTMTTLLCWCAACTSCLETTSLVKGSHKLKACLMSFTKSLKNYMVSWQVLVVLSWSCRL